MRNINDDVSIVGSLVVGNWVWGKAIVAIDNELGEVPSLQVTGLMIEGGGPLQVQATGRMQKPYDRLRQLGISDEAEDGFTINVNTATETPVEVNWMVWRDL